MSTKYTRCNLCDANVPEGHPCMNCVNKKRMKEDQHQITPENIVNFVKVLRVEDGDTVVIKSKIPDEDFISAISDGLESMFKGKKIGLMFLPEDAEIIVLRQVEDEDE